MKSPVFQTESNQSISINIKLNKNQYYKNQRIVTEAYAIEYTIRDQH